MVLDLPTATTITDSDTHHLGFGQPSFWLHGQKKEHQPYICNLQLFGVATFEYIIKFDRLLDLEFSYLICQTIVLVLVSA